MAEILKEAAFDLIYIDGDHAYSQFKRDLINYSKLCKIGGVLCGDDLPVMTTRDDLLVMAKTAKSLYRSDSILQIGREIHG